MKPYEDIQFWLPYLQRWDSEGKAYIACPHGYARYQGYPITLSDDRVVRCKTSIPDKFVTMVFDEQKRLIDHTTHKLNATFKLLPKFSIRFTFEVEGLYVFRMTGSAPNDRPVVDINVWNHGCYTCYTDNPKVVFKVDKRSSLDEVEEILAMMKLTG